MRHDLIFTTGHIQLVPLVGLEASKPRLLKYLNRYMTSCGFINRNIFDDVFYILHRNWMKRKFFLHQVLIFNFDNTWMVLEFFNGFIQYLLIKSSLFEGHSKVFNFSTASGLSNFIIIY